MNNLQWPNCCCCWFLNNDLTILHQFSTAHENICFVLDKPFLPSEMNEIGSLKSGCWTLSNQGSDEWLESCNQREQILLLCFTYNLQRKVISPTEHKSIIIKTHYKCNASSANTTQFAFCLEHIQNHGKSLHKKCQILLKLLDLVTVCNC